MNRAQGFFGADGLSTFEGETQEFKVAHLRNLYQKVGMFGMPRVSLIEAGDNGQTGPQVRGFGFSHDGSIDTMFRFLNANVFKDFDTALGPNSKDSSGNPDSAELRAATGDQKRRAVEALIIVGDSNLPPIVGQQVTLASNPSQAVLDRIGLILQRSGVAYKRPDIPNATECDAVVKGIVDGRPRGFLYNPTSATFTSDIAGESPRTQADMLATAAITGQELTLTCAPPGSGRRMAIDRDGDGVLDGDDNCPGTSNPDWTLTEIQQFEEHHPIGTKARLAFALLALHSGQRRSDVIRFGKQHAKRGVLTFTQHKGRNRKPHKLTLPILPVLQEIIDASPCGDMTFLVNNLLAVHRCRVR